MDLKPENIRAALESRREALESELQKVCGALRKLDEAEEYAAGVLNIGQRPLFTETPEPVVQPPVAEKTTVVEKKETSNTQEQTKKKKPSPASKTPASQSVVPQLALKVAARRGTTQTYTPAMLTEEINREFGREIGRDVTRDQMATILQRHVAAGRIIRVSQGGPRKSATYGNVGYTPHQETPA